MYFSVRIRDIGILIINRRIIKNVYMIELIYQSRNNIIAINNINKVSDTNFTYRFKHNDTINVYILFG